MMYHAILICNGFVLAAATSAASDAPREIRVGILAYEDFRHDLQHYDQLFADLAVSGQEPIRFRLASGTYGDLLHWLKRGRIDVAIVTPAVVAETLAWRTADPNLPHYDYLATLRQKGRNDHCRSVCFVAADSTLKNETDLINAARAHRLQFLFVDPLSLSGRIAPQHALAKTGIRVQENELSYTYSHSQSLRALLDSTSEVEQVAFVWEGAVDEIPEAAGKLRQLPLSALDELQLPADTVIVRAGFEYAELVKTLLREKRPDEFRDAHEGTNPFTIVQQWMSEMELPVDSLGTQQVSLEDLGGMLLHYARSQPRPPRLAVVLSGGGAKCSYQVGAVAALEEELARRRKQFDDEGLDIALVVGTSGGAINALPVALGISATPAGQADFRQVWTELDQRNIVQPAPIVRANIGLWFAIVLVVFVLWRTGRKYTDPTRRAAAETRAFLALGIVELAIGYLPYKPWSLLGTNHVVHHVWLWCTLGVRWSAWCLLTIGLLGIILRYWRPTITDLLRSQRRFFVLACWAALLVLPLGQLVMVLFFQQTLSGGEGIEHALAHNFRALIDAELKRANQPPLEVSDGNDAERLQDISRQIIERRLLRRDLVLTGSCLAQTADNLPGDLYFFAQVRSASFAPPFEARGISLSDRAELLLDVVMGSGSIYPLFPPRTVRDFPRRGEQVDLVDGGFAHNSPIEAAVLWGATHIVLIQASPEERIERRNFVENAAAAFNHLYSQAQRIDSQSKEQVMIFTLAPTAPHLCVLDFADNLVADSIDKGYRQAGGHSQNDAPAQARFRKELGEPLFWDAGKL